MYPGIAELEASVITPYLGTCLERHGHSPVRAEGVNCQTTLETTLRSGENEKSSKRVVSVLAGMLCYNTRLLENNTPLLMPDIVTKSAVYKSKFAENRQKPKTTNVSPSQSFNAVKKTPVIGLPSCVEVWSRGTCALPAAE